MEGNPRIAVNVCLASGEAKSVCGPRDARVGDLQVGAQKCLG